MSRVVITGATGYLGQCLVRNFAEEGHEVVAIVRPGSKTQALEGRAEHWTYDGSYDSLNALFSKTKIDLVIHVAALATYDTTEHNIAKLVESNITLGSYLLQAMSQHGCRRLINTGSYWQHYDGAAYNPVCLYAAMKEAFEKIIDYYVQAEAFTAVTLKLTDVYGPKDPRKKLFHVLGLARNSAAPLMMSGGEQWVNLLYIQDAVAAYAAAADRLFKSQEAGHGVFFAAADEAQTLREIVALYGKISGYPVNVEFGGRPYRAREVMRPFVGERLPGWQARTSLADGIQKVVQDVE